MLIKEGQCIDQESASSQSKRLNSCKTLKTQPSRLGRGGFPKTLAEEVQIASPEASMDASDTSPHTTTRNPSKESNFQEQ